MMLYHFMHVLSNGVYGAFMSLTIQYRHIRKTDW